MEDVDGERGTYMSKRVSWKGVSWGAWSMKERGREDEEEKGSEGEI